VHEGGEIKITSKVSGSGVEVEVRDNGIGIPPEKIPSLFARYSQVHNTLQKGGTGLGLFIAKQIVDAHHGRIWIESDDGKGTTVRFILPLLHHVQREDVKDLYPKEETLMN
jgi:signal transduction histidine kinase